MDINETSPGAHTLADGLKDTSRSGPVGGGGNDNVGVPSSDLLAVATEWMNLPIAPGWHLKWYRVEQIPDGFPVITYISAEEVECYQRYGDPRVKGVEIKYARIINPAFEDVPYFNC